MDNGKHMSSRSMVKNEMRADQHGMRRFMTLNVKLKSPMISTLVDMEIPIQMMSKISHHLGQLPSHTSH